MKRLMHVPLRLGTLRTMVEDANPSEISTSAASACISNASASRLCRVCTEKEARYTCPRCNAAYCSVLCFQKHGEQCTESFYRSHVESEMQLNRQADEKHQMNELLERIKTFQDQQHDDTNDFLLAERLEALACMDEEELTLECLTEEERARFLAEVADGRLSRFIQAWEAWWCRNPSQYERETRVLRKATLKSLIQEVSEDNKVDNGVETAEEPPMIEARAYPRQLFTLQKQQQLSRLSAVHGSPLLRFNLVETLFSYALVLRTFNGDWMQDPDESVQLLLHLCTVLRQDAKFHSMDEVVQVCLAKTIDNSVQQDMAVKQLALNDVQLLLQTKRFVLDALADAQAMVDTALTNVPRTKSERKAHRQIALSSKKLDFYLVWLTHLENEALATLRQAVPCIP